jgi:hypothetical protein
MPWDVMRPDNLGAASSKGWVKEYRPLSGVTRDVYSGTILRANADGSVTPATMNDRPLFGLALGFYRRGADGAHVLLQGVVNRNAVRFSDGSPIDEAGTLALARIGIFLQDSITP